ncbi:MAG: ATP-binding protein [Gammaproteobacteria bacterium]|jgi:hypothetical protein
MSLKREESEFFPRGVALGNNFCNRVHEQARLTNNIKSVVATLVTSPRRYGKTSLVLNVLRKHQIIFAYIDLYAEMDEQGVSSAILNGIGNVLYKLESMPKKAFKFVADFFANLSISFRFKGAEIKVEFLGARKSSGKLILTTLRNLDAILQKKKKKVVLFIDEFQRIGEISDSITIEGALRNIAQQTKNICFIFSGSNRHMLNLIFDDRKRPFYNLCDKIILDRIDKKDYIPFIQKKAEKRWGKRLTAEAMDEIFELVIQHPYYLNVLCHRLWYENKPPTASKIIAEWGKYAQEEKSRVMADLDQLSRNQAKVVIAISKYGREHLPTSKEFLHLTKMSSSSVIQALEKLKIMDYLYVNAEGKYQVLDPLIEYLFM